MKQFLTPKQVAQAIGVSESSLKRWCDRGLLPVVRTAGGHRRLPLRGVVQFLRASRQPLRRPELLGLPSNTGKGKWVLGRARAALETALQRGDEEECRRVAFDLYLAGHTACDICDQVIADAFHQIGDQWECGDVQVYEERRACEITLRVLYDLRSSLPDVPSTAPRAIGGTPAGDHYHLPTTMVELVLREAGWTAVSLGTNLPFDTLAASIREDRPRLFWLSVSHLDSEMMGEFLEGYSRLFETAAALSTAVAVGGRALSEETRAQMRYASFCDRLRHLVGFAETLRSTSASEQERHAARDK